MLKDLEQIKGKLIMILIMISSLEKLKTNLIVKDALIDNLNNAVKRE